MSVLEKNNINCQLSPTGEYIICDINPTPILIDMPQVIRVFELTNDEVQSLLQPDEDNKVLTVGSLVEITTGEYEGLTGIVTGIQNNTVTVDLSIWGRIIRVTIERSMVERVSLPEPWGG